VADTGAGTLRSALAAAQNGDVITFGVTGTITNLSTGLVLTNSVQIIGPGASALSVSGNNSNQIFSVAAGAAVTVSGLALRNGYGTGGGIYNAGSLALTNCVFTGCRSTTGYNGQNASQDLPYNTAGTAAANGGAIYNVGTLVAASCQFLTNSTSSGGNGGSGYGSPVSPQPYTTSAYGLPGAGGGGGGAVYSTGPATFVNCTFAWNTTGAGGAGGAGGSGVSNLAGPGGPGARGGDGGSGSAIYSSGGATCIGCTFYRNTAGSGASGGGGGNGYSQNAPGGYGGNGGIGGSAALYCAGPAQLVACTFAFNASAKGGNGGGGGHGANNPGSLGGNGGYGGNGGNAGDGGGIAAATGATVSLQNVLIALDTTAYGGAAGAGGAGGSGAAAGVSGSYGAAGQTGLGADLYGAFVSNGHNLIGLPAGNTGFTNNVRGDLVGTNLTITPNLATLASYGGSVLTCALQPGSPALDAGDDSLTGAPWHLTADARGYARLSGAQVDIGAYEHQWATLPLTGGAVLTAAGYQLTVTNVPGAYITVLASHSLTLILQGWTQYGPMTEISPGVFQWTDASVPNNAQRFYRLRNP
jgi:hypothetical protein